MKRSAFTLLQAVVLTAFLVFLAAVLFPVFFRAKSSGSNGQACLSNLRQIGFGIMQYTQDYDECYPTIVGEPASSAAKNGASYGWGNSIQPYVKSTTIFQCPQEKKQEAKNYKYWEAGFSDYYLNSQIAGMSSKSLKNPARSVLIGEGNDGLDVNDARYAHSSVPPAWRGDENSPLYRHKGLASYAFADGHAKRLKVEETPELESPDKKSFTFRP